MSEADARTTRGIIGDADARTTVGFVWGGSIIAFFIRALRRVFIKDTVRRVFRG